MNLHVTNLDNTITNEELRNLFTPFGEVRSAEVIYDAFTDQSRGFGYVEMEDDAARKAMTELNNSEVKTQAISVQEAPARQVHRGSYKVGSGPINEYRFKKN